MDFSTALLLLKQGHKLRRTSWAEGQYIEIIELPGIQPFLATQPTGDPSKGELPWMFTASSQHVLMEDWEKLAE